MRNSYLHISSGSDFILLQVLYMVLFIYCVMMGVRILLWMIL